MLLFNDQNANVCNPCALIFPERPSTSWEDCTPGAHKIALDATGIGATAVMFAGRDRTVGDIPNMATFTLLKSGAWRVQVRRKGIYAAETFLRKTEASAWARKTELTIDEGKRPGKRDSTNRKTTIGDLIDLHLEDMAEVVKRVGRSKLFTLEMLNS